MRISDWSSDVCSSDLVCEPTNLRCRRRRGGRSCRRAYSRRHIRCCRAGSSPLRQIRSRSRCPLGKRESPGRPRSSRRGSLRLSRSEGRRLSSSSAVSSNFPTHGPLAHTKPITPRSEANSEERAAGGVGGVRMDGELASHAAGHDGGLPFAATRAHCDTPFAGKTEEHTSELQSLMRISYAVFCLKTKKHTT